MADTGGENIGGVNVTIGGDYSPLVAAFEDSQTAAQQAGTSISDAFNSTAATGVDALTQALSSLQGSLETLGSQIDGLSATIDDSTGSMEAAGKASEEASGGLKDFAEQAVAVGEALVITEGLRELGTEALTAADNITHASISLTTITGSAEQAKTTIEGLEQIGASDGLAMPSLLTAATRMQAILGPSVDVDAQIKLIADGAAVMGTDIETAATKFDQLATVGNASARTLTSLGISLQSLANAFNDVVPGSDATAASVAKLFKALDESDRIAVLDDALAKFGGTAEQVAEQTFGGQWQQLANQWEAVMVQAGQALLPVITDLLDFAKTDIVPFIQSAITAFNELPGPIKDTAVAVGVAAAAVVPLTAGIAALALGIAGLQGLLPAVTGLIESFGIGASETAIAETAAAGATEALGTAAEAAEIGLGGVAGIAGGILVSGLAAAAFGFADLNTSLKSAQSQLHGISNNDFATFLTGIANITKGTGEAGTATAQWEKKLADLKTALDLGAISAKQYEAAVKLIEAAEEKAAAVNMKDSISGWTSGLTVLTGETAKSADKITLLNQVLEDAKTKFDQVAAKYQAGTATAADYLSAQNAVTSAQTSLNASLAPTPGSLQAISDMATRLAATTGTVVSAQQEQANEQDVLNSSLDLAQQAYRQSVVQLDLLVAAEHDAKAADDGSIASRQRIITAEQAVQKAYADSQKAQNDLSITEANYAKVVAPQVEDAAKQMLSDLVNMSEAVGPVISKVSGLDAIIQNLGSTIPNFGVEVVNISSGPLVGLQSALTEATAKVADLQSKMADGQNVGQQYEKALTAQLQAQIALDQESATLATGLQGATDATSLAKIAAAEAKARYDDLVIAWQSGMPVLSQLRAAQQAVHDTQAALNTTTQQSIDLVTQLAQAYPQLTSAANTATTALNQDASSLQSVASAVQSIENDISAALGTTSSSSSSSSGKSGTGGGFSGGGPGWTVTQTGFGSFGQPVESATYTPNLTQEQFDAIVAEHGLAWAKQVEAGYNAIGYNDNYSPSVVTNAGSSSTSTSGGTSSTSTSGGTSQSPIIVSGTVSGLYSGGGSTTSTTSTTSSGGTVVSSGGGGTSAIDGGSYTAVTAHQASGEVWAVTGGTASSSGGGNSSTNQVVNQSSSGAVEAAANAIGGAVQSIATNNGQLLSVADSIKQATAATQAVATAVAGLVQTINTGGSVSSQGLAGGTGGSGTAVPTGSPTDVGLGQGGSTAPLPTAGASTGSTTSNPQSVFSANVQVSVSGGGVTAAQVASIQQGVTAAMVQALRTSGARF